MPKNNESHRFTLRLPGELYANVQYWADKKNLSINDYIIESVGLAIRHENQDYDLPTLEAQRLNQLIDGMAALSSNIESLESVVTHGFDSLLNLTRGDNYLLEDEDGEV